MKPNYPLIGEATMKFSSATICLILISIFGNVPTGWSADIKYEQKLVEDMINSRIASARQKIMISLSTPISSKKVCDVEPTWREQRAAYLKAYFFKPKLPNLYYSIGGFGSNDENERMCLTAIKVNSKYQTYVNEFLIEPQEWEEVWSNSDYVGKPGSLWRAIPPNESFICVGNVATKGHEKPNLPRYRCVHHKFLKKIKASTVVWSDDGMETDEDDQVTVFKLKTSGSFVSVEGREEELEWYDIKIDLRSKPTASMVDAILKQTIPEIVKEVNLQRQRKLEEDLARKKAKAQLRAKEDRLRREMEKSDKERRKAKRILRERQQRNRKEELKAKKEAEKLRRQIELDRRAAAAATKLIRDLGYNIKTTIQGKELLSDLENFYKNNPTKIDPLKLAQLFPNAKLEIEQQLFPASGNNFKKLIDFLSINSHFTKYRLELMKGRRHLIEQRKIAAIKNIKIGVDQLKMKIRADPMGPDVATLFRLLKKYEKTNDAAEVQVIENKVQSLAASMDGLGIIPKFIKSTSSNTLGSEALSTASKRELKKLGEFGVDDMMLLANLSKNAPHAYRDLSGKVLFDGEQVVACAPSYQRWSAQQKYFFRTKISSLIQNKELMLVKECPDQLDEVDVLVLKGVDLARSRLIPSEAYLANAMRKRELVKLISVPMKALTKELIRREILSELYISDIINETRRGFGAIATNSTSTSACILFDEERSEHNKFIQWANEIQTLQFGSQVDNLVYVNKEIAFKYFQREKCRMIYGSETDLNLIVRAINNTKLKFIALAFWVSPRQLVEVKKQMKGESERARHLESARLSAIESQRIEEESRIKHEAEARSNKQARYRTQYRKRVGSFVAGMKKNINGLVIKVEDRLESGDTISESIKGYDHIRLIADWYARKKAGGWDFESLEAAPKDFGIARWKGRELEAIVSKINIHIRHRGQGEYSDECWLFGRISDDEFGMWRNTFVSRCSEAQKLNNWRINNRFETRWDLKSQSLNR